MTESSPESQSWYVEKDEDNIVWLKFDKANASTNVLSSSVMVELDKRLDEIEQMSPRGVVVYSGKKNGFIAGADIKEFTGLGTADEAYVMIRRGQMVLERLEKLACPTIAMINGFALGGGLELALACRYRIALDSDRVSLGLPEVKLGIHPGFGGTVRCSRLIGVATAMDMMLTGRSLRARKAASVGLVDKLVAENGLRETARSFVMHPPASHRPSLVQRIMAVGPLRHFVANMLRGKVSARVNPKHYPAPYAIISLWEKYAGNQTLMYEQEARSIARLMVGDTARNLVRVFLLQDRLKSLGKKSDLDLKHVHVVGAGTMGGDIAAWCALRGYNVTLQDREEKYVQPALARAAKLFEKKLRGPAVQEAVKRLQMDVQGNGAAKADVIIEAIFEDVQAKETLYKSLLPKIRADAILATNTSSIRLETLGEVLDDPSRLVGLHFFNPVAKMPLVEVVHTDHTNPGVVTKALAFTRHIDKLAVPVKSAPGFLVNRILMPYMMEAMLAADESIPLEAIDKAALGFGMPMGPAELADTVGLDVSLSVARIFAREFGKKIPESLTRLVDEKKLDRKTGEGFYKYEDGKPVKDKSRAASMPDDLQDRLVMPMLNEAVACMREGIVADADLLDAGVIFGTGFAPFTGGPMNYIRSIGSDKLKARLETLKARHGERFTPDPGWATVGNFWKE